MASQIVSISGEWNKNISFENVDPPLSIDLSFLNESVKSIVIPDDWPSKAAAKRVSLKKENFGRLMGYISFDLHKVQCEDMKEMTKSVDYNLLHNEEGEYSTPTGQIPLSRIFSHKYNSKKSILLVLYELQNPKSSPWGQPFIRVISNHKYDEINEICYVKYYVYFSRLIFELIANDSIKVLLDNMEGIPVNKIPAKTLKSYPKMFESIDSIETLNNKKSYNSYAFSLQGLMKYAENNGYPLCSHQPERLNVTLYDFQKSSYQWMLDHENDVDGLNSYFWDEYQYSDGGGSIYYFPLAGEFRLVKPPKRTGGILAEEMGLGKTVEVISLILGNPRNMSIYKENELINNLIPCKTTLIVVPTTLIGQWWRELHDRINNCGSEEFQVINITDFHNKYLHISKDDVISIDKDGVIRFKVKNTPHSRIYEGFVKPINRNNKDLSYYVVEHNLVDTMNEYDIVLTTYEQLRSKISIYKRYNWYRIVLDECQEIRVSTTTIARQVADLSGVHRWMVSGTPLHQSISDLHGELTFLKIWPFSLLDKEDGFWELKIQKPFQYRQVDGLTLIHKLLDVVMMRHTKSQRYIKSNRPLVSIPMRTIEYCGIDLLDSSEGYIYHYIECFVADAIYTYKQNQIEHNITNNRNSTYSTLKSMLSTLHKCLTSPKLINLLKLDHVKRLLDSPLRQLTTLSLSSIPFLTPEEILQNVRSYGQSAIGGLNRASTRVLASVKEESAIADMREYYEKLSIQNLRELIINEKLPLPVESSRKQPYIDILMSKYFETMKYSVNTIHDSGYAALYKLIELRDKSNTDESDCGNVECPLCLSPVIRPVVTTCIHIYCYDCILHLISEDTTQSPKCPVCRRVISLLTIMEADLSPKQTNNHDVNEVLIDTKESIPNNRKSNSSSSNVISVDDTEVIIPDLSNYCNAMTDIEVDSNFPSPDKIVSLNVNYPSLDKTFLSYYSYWTDSYIYKYQNENENNNVFVGPKLSSKICYVLCDMKKKLNNKSDVKFVIYSQYNETLDIIQSMISQLNSCINDLNTFQDKLQCCRIDSKMSAMEKDINLTNFHTMKEKNILLLTMGTSATGLTLTNATVCYIMEPSLNLSDEIQALSRIHRIGQTESVDCKIFYVKNTIEEKILCIRNQSNLLINQNSLLNDYEKKIKRKRKLSEDEQEEIDSFDTNTSKLSNVLSIDQLMYLYGSNDERYNKSKDSSLNRNHVNRSVYDESHERMKLFEFLK